MSLGGLREETVAHRRHHVCVRDVQTPKKTKNREHRLGQYTSYAQQKDEHPKAQHIETKQWSRVLTHPQSD